MKDAKSLLTELKSQRYRSYADFHAHSLTLQPAMQAHAKVLASEGVTAITRQHFTHIFDETLPRQERGFFAASLIERLQQNVLRATPMYHRGVKKAFDSLTIREREKLFEFFARDKGLSRQWDALQLNEFNATPKDIQRAYKTWRDKMPADLFSSPQNRLQPMTFTPLPTNYNAWNVIVQQTPKPTYPAIIEVDHALLNESPRLPTNTGNRVEKISSKGPGIYQQPEIRWLVEALMADGVPVEALTIYRETSITDTKKDKPSYEALKIKTDSIDALVAVCLIKGHSSYIMKSPDQYDFQSGTSVEIDMLKNDPDAYRVKCYERDVWVSQMTTLIKADKDTLGQQIKKNTQWKHLYAATIETTAAYYNAHNGMPRTDNMDVISHGPLTNKSTFRRVYLALLRNAIPELAAEKVQTFPQLLTHIKENHASLLKPRTLQDEWNAKDQPDTSAALDFNDKASNVEHKPLLASSAFKPNP